MHGFPNMFIVYLLAVSSEIWMLEPKMSGIMLLSDCPRMNVLMDIQIALYGPRSIKFTSLARCLFPTTIFVLLARQKRPVIS